MEIKVMKKDKREFMLKVNREDENFCRALQTFLLQNESIEFSGYHISHPLIAQPIIFVMTKGKRKPKTALINSSKKLFKTLKNLEKSFQKALKTIS